VEAQLREGLASLGLHLDDEQVNQLLGYAALLEKWGKVYNLTALRGEGEVLTHHLLDSLSVISPLLRMVQPAPSRLLDVGSGGGLPGVAIAIACPQLFVDCVDAVAKKAAFIQQAAGTLALPNLRGIHSRVESMDATYGVIVSRAFASLADFVRLTAHLGAPGAVWMAMKGKYPEDEIAALPSGFEMFHVEQLQVPGLNAERCLLWLRRDGP
jgi:16S rRNA (guanine527-N7)-methyltransferase